jgi:hypothetical protein
MSAAIFASDTPFAASCVANVCRRVEDRATLPVRAHDLREEPIHRVATPALAGWRRERPGQAERRALGDPVHVSLRVLSNALMPVAVVSRFLGRMRSICICENHGYGCPSMHVVGIPPFPAVRGKEPARAGSYF